MQLVASNHQWCLHLKSILFEFIFPPYFILIENFTYPSLDLEMLKTHDNKNQITCFHVINLMMRITSIGVIIIMATTTVVLTDHRAFLYEGAEVGDFSHVIFVSFTQSNHNHHHHKSLLPIILGSLYKFCFSVPIYLEPNPGLSCTSNISLLICLSQILVFNSDSRVVFNGHW